MPSELLLVVVNVGCVLSLQIVVVVVVVGGVAVVVAIEVEIGLVAVTSVGQVSGVVVLWQQLQEQGEEASVCFVVVDD